MTLAVHVLSREPILDILRLATRLGREWLTQTLAIITSLICAPIARSLITHSRVSEPCRRFARRFELCDLRRWCRRRAVRMQSGASPQRHPGAARQPATRSPTPAADACADPQRPRARVGTSRARVGVYGGVRIPDGRRPVLWPGRAAPAGWRLPTIEPRVSRT